MKRKKLVIFLAIVLVLLAGGIWFWQNLSWLQSGSENQPQPLENIERNFTGEQQKIYKGRIVEAEEYLDSLNQNNPNYSNFEFNAFVYLAQQYYGLGQMQKAKDYYDAALAKRPTDENVMVGLSLVYIQSGRLNEAGVLYSQALERNPKNADIWLRYIEVRKSQGDSGQNLGYLFEDALKKTERHPDILTKAAQFQEQQGNPAKAIELWQEVSKVNPAGADLYQNEINRLE
ncbi:MAG: hypothetical protein COU85_02265 [Candidatus Portnoybacteria bacterium CG10_big_fil_rev_8_21_14_0_10_44_7]|uniref:Uncharacterized protein n=1 Tax=Candidatus Portnoybacteria bacterium CG10_big_fil_rev_8_21_14_0_10_44_7 TaxID=1974816 RepID=A0A2M8KIF4_9BACT|nr:MAG: hypothetical protein COU85_02265 [Candidatus Portnoybacteria bacterium CG10_big_fil_rev_8_21_14_0_10_44_7]